MEKGIPKGVNLLTKATAIRYFGWGLGEAFIPIFILMFSDTFLKAGILASIYDLVFFLSLPIAAYLADNVKAKRIILTGYIMYIFIGLGYFLAGLTSSILFLILARGLNGLSYSLDQTARETYIMRHVPKSKESRVFGHFDFLTSLWWMVAVVIGILSIKYVPIYWLLLFITPTTIISFLIVSRLKEKPINKRNNISILKNAYLKMVKEVKSFDNGLKTLSVLYLGLGVVASIIYFFTPVIAYSKGESMVQAVTIVLAYTLPYLFGDYLGKIADKYKEKIYLLGIFSLMLILGSLIYISNYFLILITVFIASTIFELMYLTNYHIMARIASRIHLGEVDGSLNLIGSLGAVIGPILFGFLVDNINLTNAYLIIIGITLLLFGFIYAKRKYLK